MKIQSLLGSILKITSSHGILLINIVPRGKKYRKLHPKGYVVLTVLNSISLALEKRMSILILKLFMFLVAHEPERFGRLFPRIANTYKKDVSDMQGNIKISDQIRTVSN